MLYGEADFDKLQVADIGRRLPYAQGDTGPYVSQTIYAFVGVSSNRCRFGTVPVLNEAEFEACGIPKDFVMMINFARNY